MEEVIKTFNKQFGFSPIIINENKLPVDIKRVIISGMGGSHLSGDILKTLRPDLGIVIHSDYGFPHLPEDKENNSFFIASSYSGNTEEVVDSLKSALDMDIPSAVITVGGELKKIAEEKELPLILMPDTGIQPRNALGYSTIALSALLGGGGELLGELQGLESRLDPESFEKEGIEIAEKLQSSVPIIYSSVKNEAIAYNWKIKFNETAKIPAFINVFPELNHNEVSGFDMNNDTKELSENFSVIFLYDEDDNEKIKMRMDETRKIYSERGLKVLEIKLSGEGEAFKIFSSLSLADYTAFNLSKIYGTEAEKVPLIEEFKRRIK